MNVSILHLYLYTFHGIAFFVYVIIAYLIYNYLLYLVKVEKIQRLQWDPNLFLVNIDLILLLLGFNIEKVW
jgi:hypothetical protein